jgi:hypothetical protein
VTRRLVLIAAAVAVTALVPGGSAPAQDTGCALPANPGGTLFFGEDPPDYAVGTDMGWGLDYNDPAAQNYAVDLVYEVDGPDGHHTITPDYVHPLFHVPAEGTYTVVAHWTETCNDGVTPDRAVTSRPGTFRGVGPQPPFGGVERRQGTRREPAAALLHVGCPGNRVDEPLRVTVRLAGRTITSVRPHGCFGYKLSRGVSARATRWEMSADDFGGRIFVRAPARLTGHFELRSGDRLVFSATVRFRPDARGRERVTG